MRKTETYEVIDIRLKDVCYCDLCGSKVDRPFLVDFSLPQGIRPQRFPEERGFEICYFCWTKEIERFDAQIKAIQERLDNEDNS